ncbi:MULTISPECIES: DUF4148 domain-containing protein [Paraburkholderia]|uniref:DUF4148 domain-containing protein n=1 Tax=Paraburkholderia TaxID=1822464 RepID=UPI0019818F96|nr:MULTISPECIES: DUF4148 domain-containing protein [Paraburkholderia]MBN3854916.1 DUF4148 domain-containing protein [Paraburkholderia sp. Ac-20340]
MKSIFKTLAITLALLSPALAFAQSTNGPVTRAQVRHELVQLEQVGYKPSANSLNYPDDIQAAEAKVAAQPSMTKAVDTGYGGTSIGAQQSGSPMTGHFQNTLYEHH